MLRIRRFEEKCFELYQSEKIRGFMHLYDGEEAVSVGVIEALQPQDAIVATYREHGQALARGIGMDVLMAEMYGKQEGCCRGRGGSMHVFDRATRFYGGNAIVGGGLPLAVGIALGDKMLGRNAVTACFFGDGAVDEGAFHESMNLASLWKLPVLFVCENNLYAMGMALERAEAETRYRAEGRRLPHGERGGGRHGRRRGGGRGAAGDRADPRDQRALSAGVPHLPFPRPFDVRRAALSHQAGDRGLAQARSDPAAAVLAGADRHAARRRDRADRGRHRGRDRRRRGLRRGRHLGAGRGTGTLHHHGRVPQ